MAKHEPNYSLSADVQRVEPKCPVYDQCNGCQLQHVHVDDQAAERERWLRETLLEKGQLTPERWLPPLMGDEPWGYRGRARLSVKHVPKKGGVLVGFREQRNKRYVVDMNDCPILPPRAAALIRPLREVFSALSISDRLPQVEIAAMGERESESEPIALIIRHLERLSDDDLAALRSFEAKHKALVFLQSRGLDSIHPLSETTPEALTYRLPQFEITLRFRPAHFTQVNPEVNRLLVARVIELLDLRADEFLVDCYCGIGNFSLPAARRGARVLGIDSGAGQVEQASANAAANGLSDAARFQVLDLDTAVARAREDLVSADKLVIDPPRSGAAGVVRAIPLRGKPARIVYVSCNPETLARDAAVLVREKGYAFRAAGLVDMFPHTYHLEALTLFEREV